MVRKNFASRDNSGGLLWFTFHEANGANLFSTNESYG